MIKTISNTFRKFVHFIYIKPGRIGHAVAYMVEALCYKPVRRGFETRRGE
jgi:hypothetical protein